MMNRRKFFGMVGGASAAAIVPTGLLALVAPSGKVVSGKRVMPIIVDVEYVVDFIYWRGKPPQELGCRCTYVLKPVGHLSPSDFEPCLAHPPGTG